MINEIIDFEKNKHNNDFNKNNNYLVNHNKKMEQFKEVFEPYTNDG